jgi:hypothetical protein
VSDENAPSERLPKKEEASQSAGDCQPGSGTRSRRYARYCQYRRQQCAFRGLSAVWPIYVLAAVGAGVGAFDLPARQALLPMLVPRDHLANAISLNTIMFQTASVLGPALGETVLPLQSLRLLVRGREIGRSEFGPGDFTLEAPAPPEIRQDAVEIVVEAASHFVPARSGMGPDPRRLCYMLREITCA